MRQNTFAEMNNLGVITHVVVVETSPTKGKPALRIEPGSRHIWTVEIQLNTGQKDTLKSSRGGVREWASLDRLTEWLRQQGISHYSIKMINNKHGSDLTIVS